MKIIHTFVEYYRVFNEYINPIAVIGAGIFYAIAFALALLMLLVVLSKKILVQRLYPALKYLAWSYFLVLPLVGSYFAFQWGALNNMQSQLKQNIPAKLAAYTDGMDTGWEKYISQALTTGITDGSVPKIEYSTNDVVEIATEALYLRYQAAVDSLLMYDDNLVVQAVGYINHLTDGKVMSYAVKKGIYMMLEKSLAMNEEMSTELMETRLDALMEQGVFSKILGLQIDRLFKPLKKSTVIVFLLILAIPIIEIAIAHYLLIKKKKQALMENASTGVNATTGDT